MRSDEWIAGLADFCKTLLHQGSVVVELGSFGGESTAVFAQYAHTVYAIDPWLPSYKTEILSGCESELIRGYVQRVGVEDMSRIEALFDERARTYSNIRKIKAEDAVAAQSFDDLSIDCLYIDSIHTYDVVRAAILRWFPKIKPGGICGGHDYLRSDWPGVVDAVNEAFGAPTYTFADTSWAIRKSETRLQLQKETGASRGS